MSQVIGKGTMPAAAAVAQEPAKPAVDNTSTQAIRTIQTPAAQALRHAHPAILLGFFGLQFRALVADPVSTMAAALPVVAVLQAAYTMVCLPAVGSQGVKAHRKARPGEKKRVHNHGAEGGAPNLAVVR